MKNMYFYALLLMAWCISACSADESLPIPTPPATECTQSNGSVEWMVADNSYCSNEELYASNQGGVVINAITKTGVNITMIIDSLTPGTYPMNMIQNGILYIDQLGQTWTLEFGSVGTMKVLSHDSINNRIKATFSCNVQNSLGNTLAITNGSIDVRYNN